MNSKRSYLDTLNAGRQRRVHTSIEELNRTLETIEQRIDRPARTPERNPYAGTTRPASRWESSAYSAREDEVYQRPRRGAEPSYQSLVRDIERMRSHEDGLAAAGKISGELKGLREELRHQMTSGLKREFDALRKDIERAYTSSSAFRNGNELGAEFERLSGAIHSLAERSDDKSINLLRLELEQVKSALDTLAHEESARSSDLDRRWARMEDRSRDPDPAMAALHNRLEEINLAVTNLPESLSLRSLEEKVRTLAGAVDHFARQQEGASAGSFAQIEERLDEISRAIVASSVSATQPNFDPQPFERIEARISSLAHQIEELIEDRPGIEVIDRLNILSQRVDEIAVRAQLPEKAMEKLAGQVAMIADRLESTPVMPDTDQVLRGIEERFDVLSELLDRRQGDAIEHGQALFSDLERRLDQLATRLDERKPAVADTSGIMAAIDQRFVDLTRKLEGRAPTNGVAISTLEARLDDISAQLEASSAKVAGIDPVLIKSLEAQVSGLSAHLSKPNQPLPDFDDIGPRLDEIERSITGSRETILEAARHAADNAVRALNSNSIEGAAAIGLAQDLKMLEQLSRNSDERNTKTFEAIHETLLKIVERLGRLEEDRSGRFARMEPEQPRKQTLEHTPSIEPGIEAPLAEAPLAEARLFGSADVTKAEQEFAARRTPAEAAAAAAVAAMDTEPLAIPEKSKGGRSLFGSLTRAFSRKEKVEPTLMVEDPEVEVEAKAGDLDAPLDPKIANRPLEPGSGAPDLSAIMRRVRDERGQPVKQTDTDTAKSDFIAAARRAAQAAAAEAEIAKGGTPGAGAGRSSLGSLFNIRRKPVLMAAAAILIALAGLQLGKAFMADSKQQVAATIEPAAIEEPVKAETATMTDPMASDEFSAEPPVEMAEGPADTFSEPKIVEDTSEPMAVDEAATTEADPRPVRQAAPVATATAEPTPAMPAHPIDEESTTATTAAAAPAATAVESIPEDAGSLALREAAAQGDAKALFEIGSRYAEGRGVKQDMAAAAKWYEKAADLGLAPAQYRIGNFYEKGLGVERDVAKAKTWYQMAAEQGNASAMHNLAVLFAMGTDGTGDNESAARWFIEAADLGVKDSQFNLGILSAKGVGMPQNLEESYKWFALVAKAGDKDAASKRDEIANALRPEQLVKARAATELWKAKPVKEEANTVDVPDAWRDKTETTASVDMRQAVRNIQLILNKNGYDAGTADGVMGGKTKAAIAQFQKANGMDPTGEVDEQLVKALLEKK